MKEGRPWVATGPTAFFFEAVGEIPRLFCVRRAWRAASGTAKLT